LLVEEALAIERRAISFHGKILLMLSHSIGETSSMLEESICVVIVRLFLRALFADFCHPDIKVSDGLRYYEGEE
jgi:hypothetical protein